MKDVTKRYVEQILDTEFKDFTQKTIEETKKAFLDTIGCIIAGSQSPIGKSAFQALGGMGGSEEATVIGDGMKLPAPIAAYINGQFSVGPDLSDNYKPESIIISHPGEAVFPPVLALAEKTGATLRDVFVAVVLGYETAGRYAHALEPRRPEVYSFTTQYTLAAGLGCGKLLRFDENTLINALGIAGTLSPLPVTMPMWGFREEQRPASWHRDMPGHSSFAAVVACMFAMTDFKATSFLLDEETEYYKIAGSDIYHPELLFENWGKKWVIDTITYKSIPSCYFNQPCIEAVRLLMEEQGLKKDEIQKIELYAPTNLAKNFIYYPPKTAVDTASSVKYLTAMYIMTGNPGPDWYHKYEEYLHKEEYGKIAEKIDVFEDKKLQKILEKEEKLLGRARITTASGAYEKAVDVVKGSYENPFDERELEDKFLKLTEPVIGNKKADAFVKATRDLDFNMDIRDVISLLHS